MKFTGLIIMDGYGINKFGKNNAISPETSPNVLALEKKYPFTQLNASGLAVGLPEGQVGNEKRDGESDTAQQRHTCHILPVHPLRQSRHTAAYGQPGEQVDADGLSQHQTDDDGIGHRTCNSSFRPRQGDSGIGKGKERHDEVVDHAVHAVFHELEGRDDPVGSRLDALQDINLIGSEQDAALVEMGELGYVLTDARDVLLHIQARYGGDGEGDQYAGNRRMYT